MHHGYVRCEHSGKLSVGSGNFLLYLCSSSANLKIIKKKTKTKTELSKLNYNNNHVDDLYELIWGVTQESLSKKCKCKRAYIQEASCVRTKVRKNTHTFLCL